MCNVLGLVLASFDLGFDLGLTGRRIFATKGFKLDEPFTIGCTPMRIFQIHPKYWSGI